VSAVRAARRRREKTLKKIKIVPTDFKLTSASGLGTVLEIFDQSPLAREFKKCLPERVSHKSAGSYLLGLMVMAGHIHGVEALSDLAQIKEDPYIEKLFGDEAAAVRTIGDFLHDFDETHILKLNLFLDRMSRTLFTSLQESLDEEFRPENLIIDMDSTYHEHFGKKIEGVAWNYKNEWSLETQVAFNSLGFCHSVLLRPGNTKSGTGAAEQLDGILRDTLTQAERKRSKGYYFRADSAYCNQEVIKKCLSKGLLFTITANQATTGWKDKLEKVGIDWAPWVYSEEETKKAQERGRELPKIEVGRFFWEPSWADEKLVFPIVVKRTWVPVREKNHQGDMFAPDTIKELGEWDYYAVVTNFSLAERGLQEVMQHHAKRGNAENFVKEEKYNFKLKNFPCLSLKANHAWILLAQVAHNMIRWIAIMDQPGKPHYSKKIRNKFVFIAGRVVSHSGAITLRVMKSTYERGLKMLKEGWQFPETIAAQMAFAPSG
jgi:hypothetical protein